MKYSFIHFSLLLEKRDTKNQKNENPENAPFQKPEKVFEVLSRFSLHLFLLPSLRISPTFNRLP